MPDPFEYLRALLAAASTSAMTVLAFRIAMRKSVYALAGVICVAAVSTGLMAGYYVLQFSWTWPPVSSLNRFLAIVLPASVLVELLGESAGVRSRKPQAVRNQHKTSAETGHLLHTLSLGRFVLYAMIGRILLHGSVYLKGSEIDSGDAWSTALALTIICGGSALLILVWLALNPLSQHAAPGSISLCLSLAILCAGVTTMMAGYIQGGTAAIPLSAALAGTALASPLLVHATNFRNHGSLRGSVSIGLTGLFSLLWIGRFFGQLTTVDAIVIFLAPVLCWVSEVPTLRTQTPLRKGAIRLVAVALPLAVVLFLAKRQFDQKMAPLLAVATSPDSGSLH